MFSVVVPARNESRVIRRCLESMMACARDGEMEIVVVCNGCQDDTAAIARSFGPTVRVLETTIASKTHALNLGDEAVDSFPRFYVDADVEVSIEALRDVAGLLTDGSGVLAAAPKAVVELEGCGLLVRSFYAAWTALPYFRDGVIGVGVYAFSREGRRRFSAFPQIIADDGFARLCVADHERGICEATTFRIFAPRTLCGVLRINTRARAGLYQLRSLYPELCEQETRSAVTTLAEFLRMPQLWLHAPVYLGIMLAAKLLAHFKIWRGRQSVWERDESARV